MRRVLAIRAILIALPLTALASCASPTYAKKSFASDVYNDILTRSSRQRLTGNPPVGYSLEVSSSGFLYLVGPDDTHYGFSLRWRFDDGSGAGADAYFSLTDTEKMEFLAQVEEEIDLYFLGGFPSDYVGEPVHGLPEDGAKAAIDALFYFCNGGELVCTTRHDMTYIDTSGVIRCEQFFNIDDGYGTDGLAWLIEASADPDVVAQPRIGVFETGG